MVLICGAFLREQVDGPDTGVTLPTALPVASARTRIHRSHLARTADVGEDGAVEEVEVDEEDKDEDEERASYRSRGFASHQPLPAPPPRLLLSLLPRLPFPPLPPEPDPDHS